MLATAGGIKFYLSGDYASAVKVLQKVIDDRNESRDIYLFLGMSLARQGKDKEARKTFRKADEFPLRVEEDLAGETDSWLKISKRAYPTYTEEARTNNVSGTVRLAIECGADGQIKFVFPVKMLPHGLTEKAVAAARQIEFKPAVKNGQALTVIYLCDYNFKIY